MVAWSFGPVVEPGLRHSDFKESCKPSVQMRRKPGIRGSNPRGPATYSDKLNFVAAKKSVRIVQISKYLLTKIVFEA